jgi:hypothetical protein
MYSSNTTAASTSDAAMGYVQCCIYVVHQLSACDVGVAAAADDVL